MECHPRSQTLFFLALCSYYTALHIIKTRNTNTNNKQQQATLHDTDFEKRSPGRLRLSSPTHALFKTRRPRQNPLAGHARGPKPPKTRRGGASHPPSQPALRWSQTVEWLYLGLEGPNCDSEGIFYHCHPPLLVWTAQSGPSARVGPRTGQHHGGAGSGAGFEGNHSRVWEIHRAETQCLEIYSDSAKREDWGPLPITSVAGITLEPYVRYLGWHQGNMAPYNQ